MRFSFRVMISGIHFGLDSDDAEALFEACCGDAEPAVVDGVFALTFDRQADSFGAAVGAAVAAIEAAVPSARVLRVERFVRLDAHRSLAAVPPG